MSKAWHYDACIEVWNDVAELLMEGYRGSSSIKKLSSFVSKHEPLMIVLHVKFLIHVLIVRLLKNTKRNV